MVESIRLMPYFFVSPSLEINQIADIAKPINELRFLVSVFGSSTGTSNVQEGGPVSTGNAALVILNANRLHAESLFSLHHSVNETRETNKLRCTWRTFAAARYCFWYGVLRLSKLGPSPEIDLPSHLCNLLLTGGDTNILTKPFHQFNSDLWIWIAFSAALTLKRFWKALCDLCGSSLVEQLYHSVAAEIKAWGGSRNIWGWSNVENVLKRIAWPERRYEDAITLWYVLIGAES